MNVGIVLDPSHADFNGGAIGAGSYYWGGVHGTWFWVDPAYDVIVIGMIQQQDGGNPMTGRPYPVPDVRGISRLDHRRCACRSCAFSTRPILRCTVSEAREADQWVNGTDRSVPRSGSGRESGPG